MKKPIPREQAYRLIAPGPVTLVTAFYKGDMNVMTASWLAPVSYRPSLISLAVHQGTLTHELIKRSDEFAISIPTHELIKQVHFCGTVSGRDQNKLKVTGLHEEGPHVVRPVLIAECIAHVECSVIESVSPGDHTLFIAEVVHAQVEDEAFEDAYLIKERDLKPLHHLGGLRYAYLDEPILADAPPSEEDEER